MRIHRSMLLALAIPVLGAVAAAYIEWAVAGLPKLSLTVVPQSTSTTGFPQGFPAWLRITHYVNLLFLILLIRSGLQILVEHPRLYGNV